MDHDLRRSLDAVHGFLELGMAKDAWEELQSHDSDLVPRDELMFIMCRYFQLREKWDAARKIAEAMAKKAPEESYWWVNWAYCLRREESVQAARGVLWEASMRLPGAAIIVYNLACYACVLGEKEEARRLLDRAIAMDAAFRALAKRDPDLEGLPDSVS